jgi:acetyl esterase/lipase
VAANHPELEGSASANQFKQLAGAFGGYHAMEHAPSEIYQNNVPRLFGNLILSKYRISQVHRHLLPWPADPANLRQNPRTERLYLQASPSTHVSAQSPPTLLIHGDADEAVPFAESVAMEASLKAAGVPTGLIRVPGGAHGADFGVGATPRADWPDFFGAAVRWYDTHLKRS